MVDIAVWGRPRPQMSSTRGDGLEEWQRMLAATLSAAGRESSTSANALARLRDALLTAADVLRQVHARDPAGRPAGTAGLSAIGFTQVSAAPPRLPSSLSAREGLVGGRGDVSRELRAPAVSGASDGTNAAAFREIRLDGEDAFAALGRASDGASRRIVRGFAAAFSAGKTFQDMVREVALDVSEVGLRNFVLGPLEQGISQGFQFLIGPVAKALSGVSGRAAGGPVSAGRPFLVGERGPELFVPHRDGSIVPSAGGAVTQHITVNVEGGINNAGRKTPGQVAALIARETVRQGRRNN